MLKPRNKQVTAGVTPAYSTDSVRIESGSVVIENTWVNYDASLFVLRDYVTSALKPPRTRFFKNRGYAVYLLVGLSIDKGIEVVEGRHVPFTSVRAVPRPTTGNLVPLVGIVAIQDGSDDLNYGYLPIKDECLELFNGSGNVVDPDLKGTTGVDSDVVGDTGAEGYTGLEGLAGNGGLTGPAGFTGLVPAAGQGATGVQGMTGINWQVHAPLVSFFYA